MAVQFTPKPGKPHIKLDGVDNVWILRAFTLGKKLTSFSLQLHLSASEYCAKHNHWFYETPGEAARALHYGSKS